MIGKDFSEQFKSIKSVIDSNIETLERMIKQSDGLKSIIAKIGTGVDEDTKKELEDIKDGIDSDIKSLTTKTRELFEAYDKLVESSI
jgi:uncharacterized protein YoxC